MSATTIVMDTRSIRVPEWVGDLRSFRRWAQSEQAPEKTRVGFLMGEVWLDMSKEQFFSHNQVKNEYAFVLTGLAKTVRRGRFVPDGMLQIAGRAGASGVQAGRTNT